MIMKKYILTATLTVSLLLGINPRVGPVAAAAQVGDSL